MYEKRETKNFLNCVLSIAVILLLFACDMHREVEDNPVPTLTSIYPTSRASRLPSFTLRVNGTGFVGDSIIVFNGMGKRTTYVSSSELSCVIDPADINENSSNPPGNTYTAAEQNKDFDVLVRNTAPGGGESNPLTFTVQSNHTFHEPVVISDQEHYRAKVSFAVGDSKHLYVAWTRDTGEQMVYIYFSRSTDGGRTWSRPEKILSQTGEADGIHIGLLGGPGELYAVWSDTIYGEQAVYLSRSGDSGETWGSPVKTPIPLSPETVAVDGSGNIHAAWCEIDTDTLGGQVFVTRSTDYGVSWDAPVQVSDNHESGQMWVQEVAFAFNENGETYIFWNIYYSLEFQVFADATIHFVRSTENNGGWTQPKIIYDYRLGWGQYGVSVCSNISVGAGELDNIYVTFGRSDIFFIYSTDNGAAWSEPAQLSDNPERPHGMVSSLTVDTIGNTNVAYFGYRSEEMSFRRSTDNGLTWTEPLSYPFRTSIEHAYSSKCDAEGNIYTIWTCATFSTAVIYFSSTLR